MDQEINKATLQSKYGIEAARITTLKSNVFLVEQPNGQKAIFKCVRTENGSSYIDKFRFSNEIRMYKVFQQSSFIHLHVPALFSYGEEHILIDYIEREEHEEVSEIDFAKAYYEMQNMVIHPAVNFDLFNQLTRGVWYKGLVMPIVSLTRYTGFGKSLKAVLLFLKLHLQTKRLKRRYWLHGDVAVRNVYYRKGSKQLYFIDFENMYFTRKWPLLEIIHKCVWYEGDEKRSFQFNFSPLKAYLHEAQQQNNHDLLNCNLQHQIRQSLLISTISRIIRPKTKGKTIAFQSLLNVVLKDDQYHTLYRKFLSPLLTNAELPNVSIKIVELDNLTSH